jgi:hypothetical protein
MLTILPILIYFIASVACIPLYTSGNIFSLGCREIIQKQLYTNQGVNPDLNSPAEFGNFTICLVYLHTFLTDKIRDI